MKKTNLVFLVLLLGTILLLYGCSTVRINYDELLIAPDPANPLQGTWIANFMGVTYIHVINGMNGEWYLYNRDKMNWVKKASYSIIPNDNEFITSTNWQISVASGNDGDILTVEKNTYKRYK